MDRISARRVEVSASELLGTPHCAQEAEMAGRLAANMVSKEIHSDSVGQPSAGVPSPLKERYWVVGTVLEEGAVLRVAALDAAVVDAVVELEVEGSVALRLPLSVEEAAQVATQ